MNHVESRKMSHESLGIGSSARRMNSSPCDSDFEESKPADKGILLTNRVSSFVNNSNFEAVTSQATKEKLVPVAAAPSQQNA